MAGRTTEGAPLFIVRLLLAIAASVTTITAPQMAPTPTTDTVAYPGNPQADFVPWGPIDGHYGCLVAFGPTDLAFCPDGFVGVS